MELLKNKMLLIQALAGSSKIKIKKKVAFLVLKIMDNNKNP
jgi:hypothetical protein